MPVSEEGAALQFFVEAMKANTATLKQVGEAMQGIQDEQKETLRLVHDTRERVIRIESNSVNSEVADLKRDVDRLKAESDRREGATALASGTIRNAPTILMLVGMIVVVLTILAANGKLP